jgi:hypothetical protein
MTKVIVYFIDGQRVAMRGEGDQSLEAFAEQHIPTGATWQIVDEADVATVSNGSPPPVPATISRRQAAHIMLEIGMISAQEAVDMARMATIPPVLEAYISMLPDFMETEARIDFAANEYLRASPILDILRAHMNYTAEQTDDAFRAAALK